MPIIQGMGQALTQSAMVQQRRTRWRKQLANQASSGLGVAVFCKKEGLATKTFYGWRAWLRDSEGRQEPPPHCDHDPASFIDHGAISEGTQAWDIGLELPDGVVLTIGRR